MFAATTAKTRLVIEPSISGRASVATPTSHPFEGTDDKPPTDHIGRRLP
jgi:hypothetical protein